NGQSIYDVNARLKSGNEEAQDEYSGYIAALDALEEKLAEQIAGEEVKG
ncbi:MAG: transcriptional regulator, partial [Megasphaera micronuciformis]|nr:transcriptional regulator [Megasphaera micronuciformis]